MALRVLALAAYLAIGLALSVSVSEYTLRLLNLATISAVAVIGLNFAFGYAGLISLGHAAFMGLGAYILAILTTQAGWSPWLATLPAILGTGLAAVVIGVPLLRLKGHYLALATLGLNVSFGIVAANWIELTGGTNGIAKIPGLSLFGHAIEGERPFLWLSLAVVAVLAVLASFIQRSRYGRAMMAVRDDETAASMTGINVTATKVSAFALSAIYAAIAGCLFATHVHFISPDDFNFAHSITFLSMLIVGGEGTIAGAIIGAALLTFLPEWLRVLGESYLAFFGLMMLAILIFMPTGIVGLLSRFRRSAKREAPPAPASSGEGART
ncbi:branched-chain amino acid ABC transporter permease [Enterovirga rhinocerotis]|uniref:Amino acid/amide ABC transporter membrane protein 2 (HAAT family) n=1 Tax=Enterovirga rhinocerotis TaxID=1339210 RepID=A0A4R7BS22_9HYPH|nr:branched-chain amino acid ABC transporter permease [Enterovirga rhinocerotis]TDR88053.1 amino acid/amide ABC transporter membrane protein 2 (HAAT family) [Enterovirga rhinocerotis]